MKLASLHAFSAAVFGIITLTVAGPIHVATAANSASEIPVGAFAQLPKMQEVSLSPDGTHIAYFYPQKGRSHIVIKSMINRDQAPVVLPPVDKLIFTRVDWANNDRLLFVGEYYSQRNGTETTETRLGSITKDGQELDWIVKPQRVESVRGTLATQEVPPQIQDDILSLLPNDPDHILLTLDDNLDGKYEVRKINVHNGKFKYARGGMRGIQKWMADADNVVRLGWGYHKSTFVVMYLTPDGEWIDAKQTNWWDQGWRPTGFTEDPAVVYALGTGDSGKDIVRKLNITNGQLGEIVFSNDFHDAEGVVFDGTSGKAVGVRYVDDYPRIQYFDPEFARLQRSLEKAFPDMLVEMLTMSQDKKQILVEVSSDTDAGVVYLWDRANKSMDSLEEMRPGLDPALMATSKPVSYRARDGVEIPGYLLLPRGAENSKNLPTVMLPHGGPSARDSRQFDYLAQFIASRGYAVFQPNFRGSTGYGDRFRNAGFKQWGGLMQDDVTDGAKWLVEQGIADPQRMCIVGWSYGGYAAAMGAIKTPDLYQCAASVNGVLDLPRMVIDDKKYIGGRSWTKRMGLEGEDLKTVSPTHRASEIKIPLLLIQARDDTRVHDDQARQMAKAMSKNNKQAEVVMVDFGGHSLIHAESRTTALSKIEAFLAQNIGTK